MEKKIRILILFMIISFIFPNVSESERISPKEVKSVTYKGVKFTAPHEKMGYIQAEGIDRFSYPIEFKVYDVKYDPYLERDVQDVFITSLEVKDDKLIVINEHDEKYEIDLTEIVIDNCDQGCIEKGFSKGECLHSGSGVGSGCKKAQGIHLRGIIGRDVIIKGCNFEAKGSDDECCCFK